MPHGVSFPSFYNGRDTVQGWIYVPTAEPKGIVQLVHGFGEHSRRYLYLIVRFLEGGTIVFADDHVGHGKIAMANNTWGDWGDAGCHTVREDEHTLRKLTSQRKSTRTCPISCTATAWARLSRGTLQRLMGMS